MRFPIGTTSSLDQRGQRLQAAALSSCGLRWGSGKGHLRGRRSSTETTDVAATRRFVRTPAL